jgi:hypothetical protein
MPRQIARGFVAESGLDRPSLFHFTPLSANLFVILRIFLFRFDFSLRFFTADLSVLFSFFSEFSVTRV